MIYQAGNKTFVPEKIGRVKTKTFIERAKGNLSDPDKKKIHHLSIERRTDSKDSSNIFIITYQIMLCLRKIKVMSHKLNVPKALEIILYLPLMSTQHL